MPHVAHCTPTENKSRYLFSNQLWLVIQSPFYGVCAQYLLITAIEHTITPLESSLDFPNPWNIITRLFVNRNTAEAQHIGNYLWSFDPLFLTRKNIIACSFLFSGQPFQWNEFTNRTLFRYAALCAKQGLNIVTYL